MKLKPGDKVRIARRRIKGDSTSAEVFRAVGTVLAVYPNFAVVQWPHYRECFPLDELQKVKERGRAVA